MFVYISSYIITYILTLSRYFKNMAESSSTSTCLPRHRSTHYAATRAPSAWKATTSRVPRSLYPPATLDSYFSGSTRFWTTTALPSGHTTQALYHRDSPSAIHGSSTLNQPESTGPIFMSLSRSTAGSSGTGTGITRCTRGTDCGRITVICIGE